MSSAAELNPELETEAVRLNREAGELFKASRFTEAAQRYQSAIVADETGTAIYLCNLAATYLKLRQFLPAQISAHMALMRDPRSVKARYRRAMARRGLGNIPEALVDLASLLTTAPTHGEAMSAFAELLSVQNVPGSRRMSPENILAADFPPAYGSMSPGVASIQPSDSLRPVSDFTSWQDMDRLPPIQLSTCRTCKTTKSRDEIKTCQKCKRATYCNSTCQRADWAEHKSSCSRPPDNNVTIRLGRELTDHIYIRTHLMFYAARALGFLHHPIPSNNCLLMVSVEMVPITTASKERRRISIQRLLAIPVAILPDEVVETHANILERMKDMVPGDPIAGVWIVTNGVYQDGEETRFRMVGTPVPFEVLRGARKPGFSMQLRSHSFAMERRVTTDLDFLFSSIEDELRLDVDNYYKLQTDLI
ncbi:hypothetical protein C8J57DRAFT_1474851 [Mycena rebaudengoi]|nr:hypothetical protein C8J57DRAFT_1474851 [Mycena rebaudengoi]